MKKLFKIIAVIGLFLISIGMTACSKQSSQSSNQSSGSSEGLQSITMQFVPSEQADTMEARAKPLGELLSKQLGIPVKVNVSTDYSSMVEAMASRKIDVGFMPPLTYVKAHDRGAADALLQSLSNKIEQPNGVITDELVDSYRSMVVVKPGSNIKTIEDLKGKKIATQNVISTSGYMMPIANLRENGVDLEKDAQLVTVKGHDQGVLSVLNGDTDAALVMEDARNLVKKDNPNIMSEVVPMYFVDKRIPNDTISVRSDMAQGDRDKITNAFLEISKDPEGKEIIAAIYRHQGYQKSDDSKFDILRQYEKMINQ
ncbi:phosphate/phosphite/phosphonate ABC transporter substrate-binding protein [Holzapfeliella sp. JNUCC 80]